MIACANIAHLVPHVLMEKLDLFLNKIDRGTTITHVWGIYTLINMCKAGNLYKSELYPILLKYTEDCRPIDFAKRVESVLTITDEIELPLISSIVEQKRSSLSETQYKRAQKAIKKFNSLNHS